MNVAKQNDNLRSSSLFEMIDFETREIDIRFANHSISKSDTNRENGLQEENELRSISSASMMRYSTICNFVTSWQSNVSRAIIEINR